MNLAQGRKRIKYLNIRKRIGLRWWSSGWESACQSWGHGFNPWSGRIPHATEQLSLYPTTCQICALEPVYRNKGSHHNEKPVHLNKE